MVFGVEGLGRDVMSKFGSSRQRSRSEGEWETRTALSGAAARLGKRKRRREIHDELIVPTDQRQERLKSRFIVGHL